MMSVVFGQPDFKQGNLLRGIVNCSGQKVDETEGALDQFPIWIFNF